MNSIKVPSWALNRPKTLLQELVDFIAIPLRMAMLPDHICERFHITSLRAERFAKILPLLKGRVLDIGAGDNMLLKLYAERSASNVHDSIGLDVVDWGGNCIIVPNCKALPFESNSFDTICFIACLNHIPERNEAIAEAFRVLRPGGRVVVTMINRTLGTLGHKIWWYSEDKHRDVDEDEEMGMNNGEILKLLEDNSFIDIVHERFVYGMNNVFIGMKPISSGVR
ncbi:methyltransferase domain-containing protein [Desulfovibrio mangrovi]|uniref:class I SAM-dependent methyltransferase n=1 Tax=Desulfovibrio mangrovi TaxID=2976983 RepID=UPI0022472802|nr:methyltransferase domain-containing protein [Desulfovibrio mangrovi]UZP65854.1 methyltransferase domain-containing protein [Desulfovibrio mangrovi]